MNLFSVGGDALWIIALSIMASTSLGAWRRMRPQTRVPMRFRGDGTPLWRAPRTTALTATPVAAFLVGAGLLFCARHGSPSQEEAVILFGARATLAALFPLFHLRWLKAALSVLQQEGELKP